MRLSAGHPGLRAACVAAVGLAAAPQAAAPQAAAQPTPAAAQPTPAAAQPAREGEAPAQRDERALAIARRMAERLAGAERMRVVAEISYDAVQPDGQAIEYGATRTLAIRRPDHARVDAMDRGGARRTLVYDGRELTLVDHARKVYASVPRSGDLDATLAYLQDELRVPTPLADLLSKDLARMLTERSESVRWVDEQTIDGVACDHLALRREGVGIQLWVAREGDPVPRRVVITYERERGRPQLRADLRDWDLSPRLRDSLFEFRPEAGAERIVFNTGTLGLPGVPGGEPSR